LAENGVTAVSLSIASGLPICAVIDATTASHFALASAARKLGAK
jgi:hypothetical protein